MEFATYQGDGLDLRHINFNSTILNDLVQDGCVGNVDLDDIVDDNLDYFDKHDLSVRYSQNTDDFGLLIYKGLDNKSVEKSELISELTNAIEFLIQKCIESLNSDGHSELEIQFKGIPDLKKQVKKETYYLEFEDAI